MVLVTKIKMRSSHRLKKTEDQQTFKKAILFAMFAVMYARKEKFSKLTLLLTISRSHSRPEWSGRNWSHRSLGWFCRRYERIYKIKKLNNIFKTIKENNEQN